jgi:hypothetical protein
VKLEGGILQLFGTYIDQKAYIYRL